MPTDGTCIKVTDSYSNVNKHAIIRKKEWKKRYMLWISYRLVRERHRAWQGGMYIIIIILSLCLPKHSAHSLFKVYTKEIKRKEKKTSNRTIYLLQMRMEWTITQMCKQECWTMLGQVGSRIACYIYCLFKTIAPAATQRNRPNERQRERKENKEKNAECNKLLGSRQSGVCCV